MRFTDLFFVASPAQTANNIASPVCTQKDTQRPNQNDQ